MQVKHPKTNNIAAWTQTDLNNQIALGNFPAGTTLNDITLSTDWNNAHTITGTASTLAGYSNTGASQDVTPGAGLLYSGTNLTVPTATSSTQGIVQPDNSSITISGGIISAVTGGSGTVSTTGSPANGNLTKFSGALTITNSDLSGDVTTSGTLATTLATVNANTGSFGSSTSIPNFTVNGKGLITAAGGNAVVAPAGTLTGTTLASNVVTSSITTLGTSASLPGSPTTTTQSAGDNSTKVSTTAFVTTAVNNAISGVNPAVAVQWATTAAGDTSALTYSNGVSGIGATLTGANNTTTAIDGHTFVVGDVGVTRVLVKNDTQSPSGAFNGVYLFTALHTAGTGDVFTRALDYDQPSDINNTGAIPVINGTVNAQTSWVETATVNTVGTDPLSFTKFSLNPTTIQTTTLTNTHVWVGNGSNIATDVAVSGDATMANTGALTVTTSAGVAIVTTTGTQTLTNKRITKRVSALSANSATPAINTDTTDVVHITSQTAAITSFTTNLTGTPVDGDSLRISVTGTASVALTFGSSFESSTVTLPTTTSSTTRLDMGFFWNTETSKWRCVASA